MTANPTSYADLLRPFAAGYGDWLWSAPIMLGVSEFYPVNLIEDRTNYFYFPQGQPPPPMNPEGAMDMLFKASNLMGNWPTFYSPVVNLQANRNNAKLPAWITMNAKEGIIVMNFQKKDVQFLDRLNSANGWKRRTYAQGSNVGIDTILSPADSLAASQSWFKIALVRKSGQPVAVELRTIAVVNPNGTRVLDFLEVPSVRIVFNILMVSIPANQLPRLKGQVCLEPDPFTREVSKLGQDRPLLIWDGQVRYCYDRDAFLEYLQEPNVKFPLPSGATYTLSSSRDQLQFQASIPNCLGFILQKQKQGDWIRLFPVFTTWSMVTQ
jgi:hypothetical protein